MKAWQITEHGEPAQVLRLMDIGEPQPEEGQVVVRVRAAAANFPDVLLCRGEYQEKPALPFTPGIEVCGEVVSLGAAVTEVAVGDRVLGPTVLPFGGYAEFAVLEGARTFAAPQSLDDAQASALHIGYQTGWFGLHRRAQLRAGETLMVHAAAGGVGSAAVQLGKAAGARVIGVVGGPEKAEVARQLGADVVIDRQSQDFVKAVKDETDGRGADVIYDSVGGETYPGSVRCLAFEGRILIIGFASGEIQSAALNHALIKNYSIVGLHWSLYNRYDPAAVAQCQNELNQLADAGRITPLIGERLSMADVADGVQRLADGKTVGRLAFDTGR